MVVQPGLANLEPLTLPLPFPLSPFTLPANVTTVAYVLAGTFPPELEGVNAAMAVPAEKTLVAGLYVMLGAWAPALVDMISNNNVANRGSFDCFFTTIS